MAIGDLSFAGCIGQDVLGCRDIGPTRPLQNAASLTVTPDGRSVYVISTSFAAGARGAVSHFRRAMNGDLSFAGCVSHGVHGCREIGATTDALSDPTAIVSLDRSVYVTSRLIQPGGGGVSGGSVAHFRRDPANGDIEFAGCIGRGVSGCRDFADLIALNAPTAVAATPDGASIYVATLGDRGALIHFQRNPGNGDLTLVRCYGASRGCVDVGVPEALHNPVSVVISRDGRSVYAITAGGIVAHLQREPATGDLSFAGCIGRGATSCTGIGDTDALLHPVSAAVSDDGVALYVAFGNVVEPSLRPSLRNGVAYFRRASNGDLTYVGCIGQSCRGCIDIGNHALSGTTSVIVSPDHASVYVAADGAVTHFRREPTEALQFAGCIGLLGVSGCRDIGEVRALHRAKSIGISPDGASLYVAAEIGAVAHIRRVLR